MLSLLFYTALSVAFVRGFEDIKTDPIATADSSFKVVVTNDLPSEYSEDVEFDAYRVYLAISPPGASTSVACTLLNSTAINTTTLDVSIPASIGPDGSSYEIATIEYNTETLECSNSGLYYSDAFSLTGGTGNFSQYELDGNTLWPADDIPCGSIDCARQCAIKYYDNYSDITPSSLESDVSNCITQCQGVTTSRDLLSESTYGGSCDEVEGCDSTYSSSNDYWCSTDDTYVSDPSECSSYYDSSSDDTYWCEEDEEYYPDSSYCPSSSYDNYPEFYCSSTGEYYYDYSECPSSTYSDDSYYTDEPGAFTAVAYTADTTITDASTTYTGYHPVTAIPGGGRNTSTSSTRTAIRPNPTSSSSGLFSGAAPTKAPELAVIGAIALAGVLYA
ncbi:MAG: hypothetical protein M1820_003588 [Bogoriella megaspora]|nr:MAG: hypothetical protein M1820_003588 [Bogoriella megaspora]